MKKLLSLFRRSRSLDPVEDKKHYAEGQVWQYHARPGDTGSTLQINKIEIAGTREIFHLSVMDVCLENPMVSGGVTSELPHFPVSRETLDKSVTSLLAAPPRLIDYQDGYQEWRRAFDAGEGGVFTISVAEIVEVVVEAIARHSRGE